MRVALATSLLVAVACGGAQKPAAAPSDSSGDTSSLESKSSPPTDTPAASDTSEASSKSHAAASSTPAPAASAAAEPAASAPVFHPTPTVTGSIDGKPFAPKIARVAGKMQKDGRILIALAEAADCTTSGATLTMLVPWQDGYKADLGSLKAATKKGPGEISFSRAPKSVSTTFKPSGTVTIVKAPMDQNTTGKMKIDLASGDYVLAGDLDIQLCVSPN